MLLYLIGNGPNIEVPDDEQAWALYAKYLGGAKEPGYGLLDDEAFAFDPRKVAAAQMGSFPEGAANHAIDIWFDGKPDRVTFDYRDQGQFGRLPEKRPDQVALEYWANASKAKSYFVYRSGRYSLAVDLRQVVCLRCYPRSKRAEP